MAVTLKRIIATVTATAIAMATAKDTAIMKGPIEHIMRGGIEHIMRGATESTTRMAIGDIMRMDIRVTMKRDTRDLMRRLTGDTMRLAIEIPMKASTLGRMSTIILGNGSIMNYRWGTIPMMPFVRELQLPTQWRTHLKSHLLGCTRWRGCWNPSRRDWSIYRY